jgi:indole-3-glycerol phosphate synthase/phosphoribosylanthranilate isomerase
VAGHPDRERIVLAGGLDAANASLAERTGASLLDVCSGVEEAPGRKSRAKLGAFFAALRGAGRQGARSSP